MQRENIQRSHLAGRHSASRDINAGRAGKRRRTSKQREEALQAFSIVFQHISRSPLLFFGLRKAQKGGV